MYGRGKKLSKPGKQNIYKKPFISEENNEKNKDRMIRDIWKSLIQKGKEKEERKGSEKKKKQNERIIKDKIIRDIRTLVEHGKEDHYKTKEVGNFWNNNYIEYESNCDKNNNVLLDEYLNKTKPYLRSTIIALHSSDTRKIQLTLFLQKIL